MRGLSLVAASGGHSSSRCAGPSLSRSLLLRSTGSRRTGSVVVAHGPNCSVACGIFPDQGSNPDPLHWQADSQPLRHQGSPIKFLSWDCSSSVTSSGSASNSDSSASSTTSAVTSFTQVWNPSKSSIMIRINFFQTPVQADIVNPSHESQMFLITSRMVNPFQKVLN